MYFEHRTVYAMCQKKLIYHTEMYSKASDLYNTFLLSKGFVIVFLNSTISTGTLNKWRNYISSDTLLHLRRILVKYGQ